MAALTSGQLHFYLENRHAFFGAGERGKFAEELIFVLRERFSHEPYHVQLAALSAVGFAREAPDEVLAELVETINNLDVPQHNWAINSSIIDALGILGALEDDAENAREGIFGNLDHDGTSTHIRSTATVSSASSTLKRKISFA